MRWIRDEETFGDVLSIVRDCVAFEENMRAKNLRVLVFDSSELCTRPFLNLLCNLMKLDGDNGCYYLVLDPDPRKYFWVEFRKYPLVEIDTDELIADYLSALNEDPGGSPADAIGINWWEYFIVPRSRKWFIRGIRDDASNGGHLCIPTEWTERASEIYPYARPSATHL